MSGEPSPTGARRLDDVRTAIVMIGDTPPPPSEDAIDWDAMAGRKYPGLGVGVAIFRPHSIDVQLLLLKRGRLRELGEDSSAGVRNEPYLWDLPGGGVDFGERLEDAARREIREELSLDLGEVWHLQHLEHFPEQGDGSCRSMQHWVSHTHGALLANERSVPAVRPEERNKIVELRWVDLAQLTGLLRRNEATESTRLNFLSLEREFIRLRQVPPLLRG